MQALIGQGAMGRVFRAEDTTLQRRVALKLISLFDRAGQINHAANRFLTEARAAAALEHPHVVQVYEAGESGNVCYIAMELLEGGSLRELVDASGPLDVARACQLTAEAAEALAHAHSAGVIHRDIKPANLMLSRHGRCKVTDFGLAVMEDDRISGAEEPRRVGTPLFAAPEVIRGTSADERSDIYSLGATLFYLLTGRPPFIANNRADAMRAHLEQPVPDLRAIRAGLPDGLAEVVERSLDKDPGGRFASAGQFSRVLRVYTIPVAGAVGNQPAMSASGGPLGMSGSLAGSSGPVGASGSLNASGSLHASGSLNGSDGFATFTPANRLSAVENSGHLPPVSPPPAPEIPVARIVPQRRHFAGMPGAVWAGIVAAIIIAGATAWLLQPSWLSRNPAAPANGALALGTAPKPSEAEAIPASESQSPNAQPKAESGKAAPVAPVSSFVPTTPKDDLPPGVFRPRDSDGLKRVADGNDPSHPDKRAVVQGRISSAGPSPTGKVYHIRFAGVGGSSAFDVVYFVSSGMFEKMEQRFGPDVAAALVGKNVRVSGRMRVVNEGPEMVLDSVDGVVILNK